MIQQAYPSHPRFTGKAFGRCPAWIIFGALDSHKQAELSRLNRENRVLAQVGSLFVATQGGDVPAEKINSWAYFESVQRAKKLMPPEIARAWIELRDRGCLPNWAERQLDAEIMEKAAIVW